MIDIPHTPKSAGFCSVHMIDLGEKEMKKAALLDYLTIYQGTGSVRDLITTRTNELSILTRLGVKPLNDDLDRALVLRALSAPLSEYITSRPHHLTYSVDEIFRIAKTGELAVNNASRTSRSETLHSI